MPRPPRTVSAVVVSLVTAVVAYLIWNHADYEARLPPGMPADVPLVAGTVVSGRRTLFEDGRGYVIDIRTDLPYEEVLKFYADATEQSTVASMPGMGKQFASAELRFEGKRVFVEIHAREEATHVTTAIHLGSWW